jgi:hypothetical protein
MNGPGRSCPISYRYRPSELASAAEVEADTVYVVGGLYGNPVALDTILDMAAHDPAGPVTLVFNGDFNWLDVSAAGFQALNERVLAHRAIAGNVEMELASGPGGGCGCGYPDYVDDGIVVRSNAIIERLRTTAAEFPAVVRRLAGLSRYLVLRVGAERVGVIHGDPEELAGWRFALEAMEPADTKLRRAVGCESWPTTPVRQIENWFREAQVGVFACTHTGLPFAQDFAVDGRTHVVINNGSAGLPSFAGASFGVVTRVSADLEPPGGSLYGTALETVRCDAMPVRFDAGRWLGQFLADWPPGTPGHEAYRERIAHGAGLRLEQAARGRFGDQITAAPDGARRAGRP